MENRSEVCFAPLLFLSRADCCPYRTAGRPVPGLIPPPLLGAVAQRATPFVFHVYSRSFRDRSRCSPAPPGAPEPLLGAPPPLSFLAARASAPAFASRVLPAPPCSVPPASPFSLLAARRPPSGPALLLPLRVPCSRKLPSSSRAAEPGSLRAAQLPTGWVGVGVGVGNVIREIPAQGWAGRGAVRPHSPPEPPLPLPRRRFLPHPTPKPVRAGWPPPQRLARRQQPEECGGWSR